MVRVSAGFFGSGFGTSPTTVGQYCPTYGGRWTGILARRHASVLTPLLAFLLGLATAVAWGAGPEGGRASLLSNGTFAIDSHGNRWPDDWPRVEGTTWEKEGDVAFLRLQSSKPGKMVLVYRRVDVPSPAPAAMEIRLRVRYTNVKPGEQPWYDARIMGHFKNRAGRVLKPEPETPYFRGSSAGWIDHTYLVKVPATASYLEVMPCLFQPAAGTLDLAR